MVEKVIKEYNEDALRLYPDTRAGLLVDALAKRYGVASNQVFVGVGSDDVISQTFLTFFNSDKEILFPDITYSFYDVWAELYRIPYRTVPLKDDFTIDPDDYKCDNGGIIIPNPNAPTGVLESLDTIDEILKANPTSVVVIDEAYIDFGGTSCLPLIDKYENLLVVQTFSKSRSLAGMLIFSAIGSPKLIKYLNDVKYSFNSYTMSQTALALGVEAVRDDVYFKACTAKIRATREKAKQVFTDLGFTYPEPGANFIFVTHPDYPAKELFAALREKDIYVRYFDKPRINNYLRDTIGTDEQMEALFAFLKEYMNR